MKKIKRKNIYLYAFLVVALMISYILSGCGPAQKESTNSSQEEQFLFRLGHVVQATEPTHIAAAEFADKVEEQTNGNVTIKIYPQGQLGGDRDMTEQIQRGALDMGVISSAPISSFSKVVNAIQLPWLVGSYEKLEKMQNSDEVYEILNDDLNSINLKVLAIYDYGFRQLVTVGPVDSADDLVGLKLRVAENMMILDIFDAMGTLPTPMSFGEIYSALQNGVIDGLEQDFSGIYSEKFYEVAPYITLTRHFTWPALLIVNTQTWDSLSEEYQNIMIAAARESIETNDAEIIRVEKEYTEELEKANVSISEIDVTPLQEKVQSVYDKYASDPAVKKLVDIIEGL